MTMTYKLAKNVRPYSCPRCGAGAEKLTIGEEQTSPVGVSYKPSRCVCGYEMKGIEMTYEVQSGQVIGE